MLTEATVQADVGPGNETGIYYITICNLPFGTSWQKLKDWTRTACVVDHIEVFQSSTSGWVRVKGLENFEKAWGLLNGGIFNGRSIIASDRNRNHSIKIRELAIPRQVKQIQTQQYQHVHPTYHAFSAQMATAALYSMPLEQHCMASYSPANRPRFASHSTPQGYTHQPPIVATTPVRPVTYQAVGPGSCYAYDMGTSPNTVAYVPQHQHEGMQAAQPYPCLDEHSDFYAEGGFSTGGPSYEPEYIATEPRKLHVSPFPQQAGADEIKAWIRRKVDKTKISSMEIPKNSNSRYLKGYVLVVFYSALAANTAKQLLNKARFQGRRVIARPTREGAVIEQPGLSYEKTARNDPKLGNTSIHTAPYDRNENGRKGEKLPRPKNREVRSAGAEKERTTEKRSPLPSKKTEGSSTDKKSPSKLLSCSRELGKKDEGPVIVDGTCHPRGKK